MNGGCTNAADQPLLEPLGGVTVRLPKGPRLSGVCGGAREALKFSCGYQYHEHPELPVGLYLRFKL